MHRRRLFQFAAAIGSAVITGDEASAAGDLYTTIACGDDGPLASVQTSHAVDHAIQRLAVHETKSIAQLLNWLNDGGDPVLRVNAAGILAKTGSPDLADDVALALERDERMRHLYVTAVRQRVGDDARALAAELTNPGDSGARWCAAWLMADDCRPAIADAMRVEPSKENGGVDSFTISTMPAHDASQDVVTTYDQPGELSGTGEIVDGSVHVHVVCGIEGDVAKAGHLHAATVETFFVRAYVNTVEP